MNEIIVGNIGTVYSGSNDKIARDKFKTYVATSKVSGNRASGECVYWMKDGEIHKEYVPKGYKPE